ncbi:MAG: hypothetical protein ACYDCI_00405 [Candidatus Limnocylindrales bacterium]
MTTESTSRTRDLADVADAAAAGAAARRYLAERERRDRIDKRYAANPRSPRRLDAAERYHEARIGAAIELRRLGAPVVVGDRRYWLEPDDWAIHESESEPNGGNPP